MAIKLPNPKYIAKSYEQMLYPWKIVQVDAKFVPEACIVGEGRRAEILSVYSH